MNREDVIRMARKAGIPYDPWPDSAYNKNIERFAALVAAHVRETEFKPDWNKYQQGLADGAADKQKEKLRHNDWKLVPRKATPEMLKAMDECAQEGYDERLYEGMASSVYMAAWDASPVMGSLPTSNTFKEWFYSKPHRAKYSGDHSAYLAAQEAWEAAHEACAKVCDEQQSFVGGEMCCVAMNCAAAIRARGQA